MPKAQSDKNRFGAHQEIFIRPFRMDERGIITGEIEVHKEETFDGFDFKSLDLISGNTYAGQAGIQGVICVASARVYDDQRNLGIYTYTFEGFRSGQDQADYFVVFELDINMREEPIETHPNFEALANKYNWNPDTHEFSRNIPQNQTEAGLAAANDSSRRALNPLYGVRSYLVPGVTYRRSYATTALPGNVLTGIGQVTQPPGVSNFPSIAAILGGTRNWLKLAPRIRRRGFCIEVTEEYLLSGPKGVNTEIYGSIALGGNDSGGSSGLTLGNVQGGSLQPTPGT